MQNHPEPELEDLLWTVAAARIMFGSDMNIQAPPNLTPPTAAAAGAAAGGLQNGGVGAAAAGAIRAAGAVRAGAAAAEGTAAAAAAGAGGGQQQQQEGVDTSWVQLLNAGINDWGEWDWRSKFSLK